jgi:DNA-binding NarL/FixJ family response regulator
VGYPVVLYKPPGARLPYLSGLRARVVDDLAEIRAQDRVAVLCGAGMSRAVGWLRAALGDRTPPILVVAPSLDGTDVVAAFDAGTTSYVVLGLPGCSLDAAIRHTAAQETFVPPAVATVLWRQTRGRPVAGRCQILRAVLTGREQQIMELLTRGHSVTEVAGKLTVSEKTIRNNLSGIYGKLEVRRQSEAVLRWLGEATQPRVPG